MTERERENALYTDNIKLAKENKKLRDRVIRLEKRMNEIESQQLTNSGYADENDFNLSDYPVPESNSEVIIIITLLIFFILVMLISIIKGGVAL